MTMVQVVLSGALPLTSGGLIEKLSVLSPSYWATNALSASIDLIQISRITDENQQTKWESTLQNLNQCLWLLLVFVLIFTVISLIRIRKSR
jgi:hypothetical protein